jgi:hypothetical protein
MTEAELVAQVLSRRIPVAFYPSWLQGKDSPTLKMKRFWVCPCCGFESYDWETETGPWRCLKCHRDFLLFDPKAESDAQ